MAKLVVAKKIEDDQVGLVGIAGAVVAGQDAALTAGGAAVVVAGRDIGITAGGGNLVVAGGNLRIERGVGNISVARAVDLRNVLAGIVVGRQVIIGEGSRVYMTNRQAAAFGAGLGLAIVVVSLLFALVRGRKAQR